ncbi:hypothetical protein VNO77_30886 [Canavalia gladiata]|uniref:Uncharacterized protein n=1 Tax=Canavalia gladiata TaxID=3824 RepID=A0AAN9Q7H1_CANGL
MHEIHCPRHCSFKVNIQISKLKHFSLVSIAVVRHLHRPSQAPSLNKLDFFVVAKVSSSFPPSNFPEIAFAGVDLFGLFKFQESPTKSWIVEYRASCSVISIGVISRICPSSKLASVQDKSVILYTTTLVYGGLMAWERHGGSHGLGRVVGGSVAWEGSTAARALRNDLEARRLGGSRGLGVAWGEFYCGLVTWEHLGELKVSTFLLPLAISSLAPIFADLDEHLAAFVGTPVALGPFFMDVSSVM